MATEITKTRAAVWIIATILTPLVLYLIPSSFYIGIWYGITQHQGDPPAHIIANGMWIGVPIGLWATILIWQFIHRKSIPFSQLFGTRSAALLHDLAIGIVLGGVWVALYGLMDVVAFREMFQFNVDKLLSVPASVSAGFCEEFLFRGFVFLVVARAGGRGKSQLLWSTLSFGLAHIFWGPWGMLWAMVFGLTFGIAVLWRGSVWPAVAAHSVLNLCIEPGLIQKALSGGFAQ